jgi:hypothetical protein
MASGTEFAATAIGIFSEASNTKHLPMELETNTQ